MLSKFYFLTKFASIISKEFLQCNLKTHYTVLKCAKDWNKGIQVVIKYIKRCSTSSVIRKIIMSILLHTQ